MKKLDKIIAAISIAAGLAILTIISAIRTDKIRQLRIDDATRRAVSAIYYEPIGNGGALYAMCHGPTEKRARMYKSMEEEYPATRKIMEWNYDKRNYQ